MDKEKRQHEFEQTGERPLRSNDFIRITWRYWLVVNAIEISYKRMLSLPKGLNHTLIMYLSTADNLIV